MKKTAPITLLLFLSSFLAPGQNSVQKLLNPYKDSLKNSGLVALVLFPNGKSEIGTAGYSYINKPIVADQVFGIGSVTKLFTAVLVLQLQEEKKLDINDPIGKYIDTKNKNIDSAITIRQLLNHSSGVADYTRGGFINHYLFYPKEVLSDQKILDEIDTVTFYRGIKHEYSNSNFFLLRLIIEKVTDKPIDLVLTERIIKPFGLSHTYPYLIKDIPKLAHPTQRGYDYFDEISFKNITDESKGAGQMASNAADLCKFFKLLLVEKKILNPRALSQMLTFEKGDDDNYGLGIFRTIKSDKPFINHTGKQIGYQSFLYYDEKTSAIFVILSNDMDEKYSHRLLNDMAGKY